MRFILRLVPFLLAISAAAIQVNHTRLRPGPRITRILTEVVPGQSEREQKIIELWTTNRKKKATPIDFRKIIDPRGEQLEEEPDHEHRFLEDHDYHANVSVANERWEGGGAISQAAGRIFFTFEKFNGELDYFSCSGTAIQDYGSYDRSLIATAAHCIYDDRRKQFADNVVFIPNQDDGGLDYADRACSNDPYGCFFPLFGVVDKEWASNFWFAEHDYGFFVVPNKGGHRGNAGDEDLALEEAVRTVGLDLNNKANLTGEGGEYVYAMGLPGFTLNHLRYSRQELSSRWSLYFLNGCTMSQGSSGGPLVINPYSNQTEMYSIFSYGSGYYREDMFGTEHFVQTGCGGPLLHSNSFCSVLGSAESLELTDPYILRDRGYILDYNGKVCIVPGACSEDADCDDGVFCNGVEECIDGICAAAPAGTFPCQDDRCDEEMNECLPPCVSDLECDDGIFCNGEETCVAGLCVEGENPCDGANGVRCDLMSDSCVTSDCSFDSHCDDGIFCNGPEICVDGQCNAGQPPCGFDQDCNEEFLMCPMEICEDLPGFCVDEIEEGLCCVCLPICPPDNVVIECAPRLFFPNFGQWNSPCLSTTVWGRSQSPISDWPPTDQFMIGHQLHAWVQEGTH